MIHRDIKPGNLLMAADGHVKLSDFGIARLFGYSKLTSAGSVLGTVEYMAPEQAEGRPADSRADLYSLGALMYVLLARRPVFRGKSLPEMLHKQRFEQPEPIHKHVHDLPEELEHILDQLLEKDPDRRIPNADVLARRTRGDASVAERRRGDGRGRRRLVPFRRAGGAGPRQPHRRTTCPPRSISNGSVKSRRRIRLRC